MANSDASARARAASAHPGIVGLLDSTVGLKIVMAVTGAILVGFVVAHFLGNSLIFTGRDAINAHGAKLHALGGLLWVARLVLLASVLLHIGSAFRLIAKNTAARPMAVSGPLLLVFVLFHLAHLSFGVTPGPYAHSYDDVYGNLVQGFQIPWVTGLYLVSMLALGNHLFHGIFSMFQSLGVRHGAYDARWKQLAVFITVLVTVGNISIALSVLLGLVR